MKTRYYNYKDEKLIIEYNENHTVTVKHSPKHIGRIMRLSGTKYYIPDRSISYGDMKQALDEVCKMVVQDRYQSELREKLRETFERDLEELTYPYTY